MKLFTNKNGCTGCGACVNACGFGAITMKTDLSGFFYPQINTRLCTGCGRCAKVCPQKQKAAKGSDSNIYLAVQAADDNVRMESSSGGAFSLFAESIISHGGAVCAASLCDDMTVRHVIISDKSELNRLRKTKYVQSDTGTVFTEIRTLLEEGREVLFTGTPCQCAGLLNCLGKTYEKLITAALVCYGVPSPKVFSNYLRYLGKKHGGKVTSYSFRDKRNHDNGHTVSYSTDGGKTVYSMPLGGDPFSKLYFRNHIIRPSCYGCRYATPDRPFDITLGDFWGIEKVHPEFDDGDGTSLVILHSEKSRFLWEEIKNAARYFKCRREDVLQPRLQGPTEAKKTYPAAGLTVGNTVFKRIDTKSTPNFTPGLVSCVTPVWNGEKWLRNLLDSLLAQTYKKLEVIISDDGSTDGSVALAETYRTRFEQKNIRYIILKNPHSCAAAALSAGLKEVTGEFLIWPDADDVLEPESVEERVVVMNTPTDTAESRETLKPGETGTHTYPAAVRSLSYYFDGITGERTDADEKRGNLKDTKLFFPILESSTFVCCGCYMLRSALFFDLYPDRSIPVYGVGQNFQMLLPYMYKHECVTLSKELYGVCVHAESHSRRTLTKQQELQKYKDYEKLLDDIARIASITDKADLRRIKLWKLRRRGNIARKYDLKLMRAGSKAHRVLMGEK